MAHGFVAADAGLISRQWSRPVVSDRVRPRMRQPVPPPSPAAARPRDDARWGDAIRSTVGLWLFVLLIYLPVIIQHHAGEGAVSIALDSSTVFVSMVFATPVFLLFRATLERSLGARIVLLGGAVVLTAVTQAAFDLLFTAWVANHLEASWATMPTDLRRGYGAMINYVSVFAVNLTLFQLAYGRRNAQRRERQMATVLAAGTQAELDALRFKLNPHFLFNTLNGISAMIVTKRLDEADRTVERLSAFLRASLAGDPDRPVTVEEELAALENYARIEELRFGDRLHIAIDCAPDAAALPIPPLIVQPLVEQLVEEASRRPAASLVEIAAHRRGDHLCVAIDHPDMELPGASLAIVRQRLHALYGAAADARAKTGETLLWLPAGPRG